MNIGHVFNPCGSIPKALRTIYFGASQKTFDGYEFVVISDEGALFKKVELRNTMVTFIAKNLMKLGFTGYKDDPDLHDAISYIYPNGYRCVEVPFAENTDLQGLFLRALRHAKDMRHMVAPAKAENAPAVPPGAPVTLASGQAIPSLLPLCFDYINYRGERSHRRVLPRRMVYEKTEWHPEEQWLLIAWDIEKQAERSFAMKEMYPEGTFKTIRDVIVKLDDVTDVAGVGPKLRSAFGFTENG